MIWVVLSAGVLATIPAGLRWLRVAQREHYLAGAVATFAGRWWTSGIANVILLVLMVIGLVGSMALSGTIAGRPVTVGGSPDRA